MSNVESSADRFYLCHRLWLCLFIALITSYSAGHFQVFYFFMIFWTCIIFFLEVITLYPFRGVRGGFPTGLLDMIFFSLPFTESLPLFLLYNLYFHELTSSIGSVISLPFFVYILGHLFSLFFLIDCQKLPWPIGPYGSSR